MRLFLLIGALVFCFCGCSSDPTSEPPADCATTRAALEVDIREDLDTAVTDADFTLMLVSDDGRTFTHSGGASSPTTLYESASTSKLVTAVVILSLVDDGVLSLDDHPQDYIDSWPTAGNISLIQLRHLLNFTSGLTEEALCIHFGGFDFENCIDNIVANNNESTTPGSEFYYSSSHLQVAGLMAIEASGLADWNAVFTRFQSQTGLMTESSYDLPSLTNPRLAGGMHWHGRDYLELLAALHDGTILSTSMRDLMLSDQLEGASIGNSPSVDSLGEDWHYGFGTWIECHATPFHCTEITRVSSPGAYGAYPLIDYEHGYYGILARQGDLGTFDKGYELFISVAAKLEAWAGMDCE